MWLNQEKLGFTVLLGIFAGLPALSIDLSAPTLAILPAVLNTTVLVAGLTLSLFLVGFAVGQFFGGHLSDCAGRRGVLIGALLIYSFAAMCCYSATSGFALVASRFLQGIGAGACAVQAMAIVQDVFRGEHARRKQSYVVVIIGVLPMLAPAIGALLVHHYGWRSVHLILMTGGLLLTAIAALTIRESNPAINRPSVSGFGFRIGLEMLREQWFFRIVATNALSYGGIFAYIAGAPVVIMARLGYSNGIYAALFAATATALTFGALSNARLGRRGISSHRMISAALVLQAIANVILVLVNPKSIVIQLGLVVPALILCCFSRGIISPNLSYLAVNGHGGNRGMAAAMIGLSQLLVGALSSVVVAILLPHYGYKAVALPMAVLSCSALLLWRLLVVAERTPSPLEA